MFGLKTLYARYLSRKGEHAAALAMCDMKDIYALSRAGMHLSVLELSDCPSIERALALGHTGQTEAALEMAQRYAAHPDARTLLGFLATHEPEQVAELVQNRPGLENVSAYCRYTAGEPVFSDEVLRQISPLHGMALALKAQKPQHVKERYRALFTSTGLLPPEVEWLTTGLDYNSLASGRNSEHAYAISRPLISVVLTAHNEEKYLAIAVNSLLAQSWNNIEVIIVNDASTDGTQRMAEELANNDGRIKVIELQQNVGLWAAKNAGLQHCSGELITMHDADDWSHPRKLELQAEPLLSDGRLQATTSYMLRIDQESGLPFTRNARNYLRWNPSSFMFRATLCDGTARFLDDTLGSDCEFVARIETLHGTAAHRYIRQPLSIGLQRGGSLSNRFRGKDHGIVRMRHWERWRAAHAAMVTGSAGRYRKS
jgi:hypothetical protein